MKGIDVLVRAVSRLPRALPLELCIYGAGDGPEERAYAAEVSRIAMTTLYVIQIVASLIGASSRDIADEMAKLYGELSMKSGTDSATC